MAEKEIAAYFINHTNVCGRIHNSQINKTYTKPVQFDVPFHQRLIRYVLSFALISKILGEKANAQSDSSVVKPDSLSYSMVKDSIINNSLALQETSKNDSLSIECTDPPELIVATEYITVDTTFYKVDIKEIVLMGAIYIPENPTPTVPVNLETGKPIYRISGINPLDHSIPEKPKEKNDNNNTPFWAAILPPAVRRKRLSRK